MPTVELSVRGFPMFDGYELSWSIGLYATINEINSGLQKARAIIRAMAEHRPDCLLREYRDAIKNSTGRSCPSVSRQIVLVIREEVKDIDDRNNAQSKEGMDVWWSALARFRYEET